MNFDPIDYNQKLSTNNWLLLAIAIGIFAILILLIVAAVYIMQAVNKVVQPINEIVVIARDGIEDVVSKTEAFVDQVIDRLPPESEIKQKISTGLEKLGQEVKPKLHQVAQDVRPTVESIGSQVNTRLSQIRR